MSHHLTPLQQAINYCRLTICSPSKTAEKSAQNADQAEKLLVDLTGQTESCMECWVNR